MYMKKNESIWEEYKTNSSYPTIDKNIETDIVIVGGGITGILIAHRLQSLHKKVIVLEKNHIGNGISKNTTAVISSQHDTLNVEKVEHSSYKAMKEFLLWNKKAMEEYAKLSKKYFFDFEYIPSIIYSTKKDNRLEEELSLLQKCGLDVKKIDFFELPLKYETAIKIEKQAQMNPLKLINELSKELTIYENSFVTKIKRSGVEVNNCFVKANTIIVATHFPFVNSKGFFFVKMRQIRSTVLSFKTTKKLKANYLNMENNDYYARQYKENILIGSKDFEVGKKVNCEEDLINFANKIDPNCKIEAIWRNQDCVTLDGYPYIGKYSRFSSNLFVATGFNLWGMSQAMISALILSEKITNPSYIIPNIFSPQRRTDKKELFYNLKNFCKTFFVVKKKRCTHMYCKLNFNEVEQTWDCPCHGSRFDINGKVIDNPSQKEL